VSGGWLGGSGVAERYESLGAHGRHATRRRRLH